MPVIVLFECMFFLEYLLVCLVYMGLVYAASWCEFEVRQFCEDMRLGNVL